MANITPTTIPLGSKPYNSPYHSVGVEICENLYLELSQSENAKAEYWLVKIPGMQAVKRDTENMGACRGLFTSSAGRTFGVWGSSFGEIDENGSFGLIGSLNSTTGPARMAENGRQLIIVDGMNGWIYDYKTSTFVVISDDYFPGNSAGASPTGDAPTHVVFNDTYFIVNVPGTNQYMYSNTYYQWDDVTTVTNGDYDPAVTQGYWNPINAGYKIAVADNIVALIDCQNYIWLFGKNSCEVHYDTGNYAGQLYARYQGAIMQVGCTAPQSVAKIQNNVYWLGADNTGVLGIFTNEGMQPKRISKRGIEQIITDFSSTGDAIGFTYSQAGHSFYVLQFPAANRCFVYDMVTDSWHERTYMNSATGQVSAWKGIYSTENWGIQWIGHTGHSSRFQLNYKYYENDNPDDTEVTYIRCVKTSPIIFQNGQNIRWNSCQVLGAVGQGTLFDDVNGVGTTPRVAIAYSDDMGNSWVNERYAPLGQMGKYETRSRITGCGMARNRVWRVTVTDPVPVIIVGLAVEMLPCRF